MRLLLILQIHRPKTATPASAAWGLTQPSHHWPHGVLGEFNVAGTKLPMADLCHRLVITMIADSGATDNYIHLHLIVQVREFMNDSKLLTVPHLISPPEGHVLKGVAESTVNSTVTDDRGNKQCVCFSAVVVPGLGTNLFSVIIAMQKRAASPFVPNNRRLKKEGSAVLPMQDLGVESTAGKRLRSINVGLGHGVNNLLDLGVTTGSVAMQAATADMWHRQMGHINRRSMDVLRKVLVTVSSIGWKWRRAVRVISGRMRSKITRKRNVQRRYTG